MIGYIKGSVVRIEDNSIILDNNGIGYQIQMPLSSLLLLNEGQETTIHTFMAFGKEDVSLCGFLSRQDLDLFKMLLKVSGIGPKGAMNILSGCDAETLKIAILTGDDKLIAASKGVSAKTAQKIILELKGKISKEMPADALKKNAKGSGNQELINAAVDVVAATGFDRAKCMKAVSKIEITPEMDLDKLIDEIFIHIDY
ncbi:MAG: Holliday junction branch migration protein RuvA [Parasporobacterium sp.]|nr:Holliday junction branch migration protein RuvA [Parasporobacterium sp.]MBR3644542.1 Holliday junction branch migration protein RuvA [Parasporobacterium sp.]